MAANDFGLLHLQTQMPDLMKEVPGWVDDKGMTAVLAVAVILYVAGIPLFARLFTDLARCTFNRHGPEAFEHSIQKSRSRNYLCALTLPANILMIDRLGLYDPSYFSDVTHWGRLGITLAALVAFFGLRLVVFAFFKFRRVRSDELNAARNNILSVWVFFMFLMDPAAFIMLKAGVPDAAAASFFLCSAALFLALSYLRSVQVLKNACGLFPTFLYLCAFEFAPAALLILSAKAL